MTNAVLFSENNGIYLPNQNLAGRACIAHRESRYLPALSIVSNDRHGD